MSYACWIEAVGRYAPNADILVVQGMSEAMTVLWDSLSSRQAAKVSDPRPPAAAAAGVPLLAVPRFAWREAQQLNVSCKAWPACPFMFSLA